MKQRIRRFSGGRKTLFSARFCAYFQILHSLPNYAKNSEIADCRILVGLYTKQVQSRIKNHLTQVLLFILRASQFLECK